MPGLTVRSMSVRIIAAGIDLVAQFLTLTLRVSLVTASDRLKLIVIAVGIIRLEAVSVRLLVIKTEAHGRILPGLAVRAMLIVATLVGIFTEAFAVARVMPVG